MHQSPRAHVAKKGHSIDARDRWSRRGSTATAGPPGMVPGARRSSEAEECENRPGDHTGALKNDRHQRFMKPERPSRKFRVLPPLQLRFRSAWGGASRKRKLGDTTHARQPTMPPSHPLEAQRKWSSLSCNDVPAVELLGYRVAKPTPKFKNCYGGKDADTYLNAHQKTVTPRYGNYHARTIRRATSA